jgi:hypothetical protein
MNLSQQNAQTFSLDIRIITSDITLLHVSAPNEPSALNPTKVITPYLLYGAESFLTS